MPGSISRYICSKVPLFIRKPPAFLKIFTIYTRRHGEKFLRIKNSCYSLTKRRQLRCLSRSCRRSDYRFVMFFRGTDPFCRETCTGLSILLNESGCGSLWSMPPSASPYSTPSPRPPEAPLSPAESRPLQKAEPSNFHKAFPASQPY